ncbi:Uridine phosphorylase [Raoultella planticola]|nr:Uridine phosphorylase [Raoultella planticola]
MSKSDVFHLGLTKNDLQGLRWLSSLAIRSVWKRSPR